ncbi:CD63 antigen-like [Haliotis rufescens]|uniref:CD63 antigen-like n=1 Tax=Haliotis rufescens TaxID=6454 RepID=UPI00201FAABA|nr:CD63 antigen-like [Haliotis rufescens]
MGLFSSVGQCVLILLNVVFTSVALSLLVIGAILKFRPGLLLTYVLQAASGITAFNISTTVSSVPVVSNIGLALLVLGAGLFVICFFGCYGACCGNRVFLIIFCILMGILCIAVATVVGLLFVRDSPLNTKGKETFKTQIRNEYKGPLSTDTFSIMLDLASYSLQCCASTGPTDFDTSASWTAYNHKGITETIEASPACCKKDVLAGDTTLECAKKHVGVFDPTITNTQGCYDRIHDLVEENKVYVILGAGLLLLLMVLEIVFAIILIRKETKDSAV